MHEGFSKELCGAEITFNNTIFQGTMARNLGISPAAQNIEEGKKRQSRISECFYIEKEVMLSNETSTPSEILTMKCMRINVFQ